MKDKRSIFKRGYERPEPPKEEVKITLDPQQEIAVTTRR